MKLKILSTNSDLLVSRTDYRHGNGVARKPKAKEYVTGDDIISLASRVLLSAIFLKSGLDKILHPVGTMQYMVANGMTTMTGLFLACAIVIEIVGGLSLLLGYKSRWGTMALVVFLIPATLIFHRNFSDQIQTIMFMKNLAILGGLLMVIQNGSGGLSLSKSK